MKKTYLIAGLTVTMDSFGKTENQAEAYRTEECENPDIEIESGWRTIPEKYNYLPKEDREYMMTGSEFYHKLLNCNGLLLHASAAVVDGRAYLFSAPSGTGKSTHTALWQKVFGEDRVKILNDDKPALRLEDGVWYAYGTPWSGKTDKNINMRAPVAGICFLDRADTNSIEPYSGRKAVLSFMEQTARPLDPLLRGRLLELVGLLFEKVPVWHLHCNMEPEAAELSRRVMSGAGKDQI